MGSARGWGLCVRNSLVLLFAFHWVSSTPFEHQSFCPGMDWMKGDISFLFSRHNKAIFFSQWKLHLTFFTISFLSNYSESLVNVHSIHSNIKRQAIRPRQHAQCWRIMFYLYATVQKEKLVQCIIHHIVWKKTPKYLDCQAHLSTSWTTLIPF